MKRTSRGEKQGECKILENTLKWGYEVFKVKNKVEIQSGELQV